MVEVEEREAGEANTAVVVADIAAAKGPRMSAAVGKVPHTVGARAYMPVAVAEDRFTWAAQETRTVETREI